MLRLSLFSRDCLAQLRDEIDMSYDARQQGILHFYGNPKNLHKNQIRAEHMAERECPFQHLDSAGVADLELPLMKFAIKSRVGCIIRMMKAVMLISLHRS
jgi:D-amino-acid dehydrogenase